MYLSLNGPQREKTCLWGFANNKGADQPAYPRSLISAFVIRLLESFVSRHALSVSSVLYLVSVAEETGLNLTLSEIPKTGFVAMRPKSCVVIYKEKGGQITCTDWNYLSLNESCRDISAFVIVLTIIAQIKKNTLHVNYICSWVRCGT